MPLDKLNLIPDVNKKDGQHRFTQTKIHSLNASNAPFGDDIQENTDGETIIFHNITFSEF
jgi:hypothetical protein